MIKPLFLACAVALCLFLPEAPQQQPTSRQLFTTPGRVTEAASSDGRRIYYVRDITELRLRDVVTGRDTLILAGLGERSDLDLSVAGDRLAFVRPDEDGGGPFVWTLAVDPATGLASAPPRRVSVTSATDPSISPDGRLIAFHAPQRADSGSLVVVPSNGGPERVIARTAGWVWPIRWTPDGHTLYYGLSIDEPARTRESGIDRVAVAGGAPQRVVETAAWGAIPGLSPDGRVLMYWTPNWDTLATRSAEGRHVSSTVLQDADVGPQEWINGNRTLTVVNRTQSAVAVRSLDGGAPRIIAEVDEFLEPVWSPDGRRVAFAARRRAEIVVAAADGSSRQVFRTQHHATLSYNLLWSPDGRMIAYGQRGADGTFSVIDASTGAERKLGGVTWTRLVPRWRSDSRAILYASADESVRAADADSTRDVTIREITTTGSDRVVGRVPLRCLGQYACQAKLVSDSLVATWQPGGGVAGGAYRIVNFRRNDAGRFVFTRNGAGHPVPSFADNAKWMTVRAGTPTGENRIVHVIAVDGSANKTLTLPFRIAPGPYNPWISADGRQLVIASVEGPQDTTLTFHRVEVETGRTTSLGEVRRSRDLMGLGISPDGRSVAFAEGRQSFADFYEVDVSALLRPRAVGPGR